MSTYRNFNSADSFVCIDLTHPTCFRNNECTHKCHSNLRCALDNSQAQTNGDLFTQVKLIHYLSTSPPPPLLCACVPLNPSIMVYDCNLNTRQTRVTHHNTSCLSQLYKLIISQVASGQYVTKHLDYLGHELKGEILI